jgi:uridine phosphorylase
MSFDQTMRSATQVASAQGRQYHTGLAPGEVAPNILLVGDPARAHKVASRFSTISTKAQNREYVSYTGRFEDLEVTVVGTGIGAAATEIALIELFNCVERPVIIRCGSSGALQPEIKLGDVVISQGALRLENTTASYVESAYPAISHYQVVAALLAAAAETGIGHHLGLTATAPGFFAAQARQALDLPVREPDLIARLQAQRVANLEMETACVLTLSALARARAAAICAVFATRYNDQFIEPDQAQRVEAQAIDIALRALVITAQLDQSRDGAPYWTASHGAASKSDGPLRGSDEVESVSRGPA